MAKPVRLRQLASTDLEHAGDHYRHEGGEQLAPDFIVAVQSALRRIGRSPHVGSLRFAYELAIPDLRAWSVPRFRYVVFYVVTDDEIDVWRILHFRRDLSTTIEPPTA